MILALALTIAAAGAAPATENGSMPTSEAYFLCIRDTSRVYARGGETAEAIAVATVSACNEQLQDFREAWLRYADTQQLGSNRALEAWNTTLRPNMESRGKAEATRWVIEARLPKS